MRWVYSVFANRIGQLFIVFSMTYVLLMNFSNGMYALDAVLRYVESKFGLRYDIGRIGVDGHLFEHWIYSWRGCRYWNDYSLCANRTGDPAS